MKALVCTQFGPPEQLQLQDLPEPDLGPNDVRIAVQVAGVNFADCLKVMGTYQEKPSLPWVPGTELSGVVTQVGHAVRALHVGQRVLGMSDLRGGAFAQSITLPVERVIALPDNVAFEQAAAMPVVYGTALYALLDKAQLQRGSRLLVLGAAGGVGLAAVGLGKLLGAEVIAAASSAAKRQMALDAGATHVVDYTQPGWSRAVRDMLASGRVDVVFDPVGGEAFTEAEKCLGWEGKYLLVGFASGQIPSLALNKPLVKGYDLLGVRYDVWRDRNWPAARQRLEQALQYIAGNALAPLVSELVPLDQAALAIRKVSERGGFGKILIAMG